MSNVFIGPSHSLRFMALVLASLRLKTDFMKCECQPFIQLHKRIMVNY